MSISTISSILDNSTADGIEVVDQFLEQPEKWQTWIYGLLIISVTAFSAPLGIMLTPLLNKSLYEKVMIFLVALGIGAMSGSCLFILLPHAFNITQAIYIFFGVDRLIQCFIELRRRRQHRSSQVHASTLNSMANNFSKAKKSSIIARTTRTELKPNKCDIPMKTYSTADTNDNNEEELDKEKLRDEIDVSNYTNTLARTLSTRRRIAVIKPEPVDQIQYQQSDGKMLEIDGKSLNSPTPSRNVSPLASPQLTRHMNGNTNGQMSSMHAHFKQDQNEKPPLNNDKVAVSVEIHEKHVIEKVEIASVAYMIVFGSSMNNFVDGMSIGAAFSDSVVRGLKRTLIFSIVPMVLSFAGFAAGVYLDNMDDSYDGLIFSVSAGMYLYIVLGTLLPEIREQFNEQLRTDMAQAFITTILQVCGIFVGLALMFLMNIHNEEI
ncbi:Zrt (ZRT), Irt-(IRT-) like Protein Transporter [Aphelenchoides bicaudatus]|nr:Zrt (ZRT), Irt-(IRT-) like Protein Transporter [Aphelenchoides bicaudatus]